MTSLQKAIKYLAIAFAIFLIVSIFGGIITGLRGVSYLLSNREEPAQMQVYPIDGEVTSLSMSLSATKLEIKTADKFYVESNHKYISVELNDGQLCVDETKELFAQNPEGLTVVLNVPKDFIFDYATIETGAGKVEIDTLSADVLKLSLGAGEANISKLTADSRAEIDGGAGALMINGGKLNNLDLDMGVGELTLTSRIEGDSSLDYGIGETKLTLLGSREDYQIEIDKGIGDARLQGESMSDDSVYGTGKNKIEIDGGIGEINIDFLNDEIKSQDL